MKRIFRKSDITISLKRSLLQGGLLFVLVLFFQFCKHESVQPAALANTDTIPAHHDTIPPFSTPDSVCFNTQIYPMIISNCAKAGCHDAATHAKGLNASTYAYISYYANQMYSTMFSYKMPPSYPKMTADQNALFKRWIDEGKKNTVCKDDCDTLNVTYTSKIQPLFNTYCNACHSSVSAASSGGSIVLDNYQDTKTQALNNNLLCALQWKSGYSAMPKGSQQLSYCNIRKIAIWIAQNCPQ